MVPKDRYVGDRVRAARVAMKTHERKRALEPAGSFDCPACSTIFALVVLVDADRVTLHCRSCELEESLPRMEQYAAIDYYNKFTDEVHEARKNDPSAYVRKPKQRF